MGLGMMFSFIARVEGGRMSAFLSLYLISNKDKGYFWCIGILQSFFCFRIAVAKYCLSTPKIV